MGESEIYRVAFEKGKELTDRALKLAEVGKQKPMGAGRIIEGCLLFLYDFRSHHNQ
jgi:hypothetical protein